MLLVVDEFALVDIARRVFEYTLPVLHAVQELALIVSSFYRRIHYQKQQLSLNRIIRKYGSRMKTLTITTKLLYYLFMSLLFFTLKEMRFCLSRFAAHHAIHLHK